MPAPILSVACPDTGQTKTLRRLATAGGQVVCHLSPPHRQGEGEGKD